jgi:cation diffusion facilitator family transporter
VQDGSRKAIVAAFAANLGIAVAKFSGFLITGSAGLLAESGHSLADTGNQGLLLLGSKRARREADEHHPFGFGRERFFWAFVVALVLFSMGGLFAIYEGIHKVGHPEPTDNPTVAFVILGLAVALETFSLRTALREAAHVRGERTVWQFIRASKQPELPVVVLEDIGAEIGLTFAIVGLALDEITGNARWDAVGSLAIGVLLVVIAAVLAVEMKGLLIGESADPDDIASVRRAMVESESVRRVIHVRTEHIGPDELLVAAKLEFDATLSFAALAEAIDATERRVRAAVPSAHVIYIEPDVYRPEAAADALVAADGDDPA